MMMMYRSIERMKEGLCSSDYLNRYSSLEHSSYRKAGVCLSDCCSHGKEQSSICCCSVMFALHGLDECICHCSGCYIPGERLDIKHNRMLKWYGCILLT